MAAANRHVLKYLGSLRGSGGLRIGDADHSVGQVDYEIDCYSQGPYEYADGQIDGRRRHLQDAFDTGAARIALPSGDFIDIVVGKPRGESGSEITVSGKLPFSL